MFLLLLSVGSNKQFEIRSEIGRIISHDSPPHDPTFGTFGGEHAQITFLIIPLTHTHTHTHTHIVVTKY